MTRANPRPRSIALYRDIEAILETAVRFDRWPAVVEITDPRKAIRWVQRANIFRSILREQEEHKLGLPPGTGSSIYDGLIFRAKADKVFIEPRPSDVVLRIAGEVVSPVTDVEVEVRDVPNNQSDEAVD